MAKSAAGGCCYLCPDCYGAATWLTCIIFSSTHYSRNCLIFPPSCNSGHCSDASLHSCPMEQGTGFPPRSRRSTPGVEVFLINATEHKVSLSSVYFPASRGGGGGRSHSSAVLCGSVVGRLPATRRRSLLAPSGHRRAVLVFSLIHTKKAFTAPTKLLSA